jgi:hypothetical protein
MSEESHNSADSNEKNEKEVFEINTEIRTTLFKKNERNASSS